MFCDPYFSFIITKRQKPPLALLIFNKMSRSLPLKALISNLLLESWLDAIPVVSPFLTHLSRHLLGAGFCCPREGSAVVPVDVWQQRSCSEAGSSEHLASASILQKRRKSGKKMLENDPGRTFPKT